MACSGTNFFLSNYSSFNYESYWKCYFDFKSTGIVSSGVSGASPLYSGIYHSTSFSPIYDYRNISKSGNFSSYVEISPSTGLWGNQMSLVFLTRKNDSKNGVLFNCLETGLLNGENVYKGFLLGYSDGSKPFFGYRGKDGFQTYSANFDLTENHLIYFVRDGDNVTLGKYDYFTQEFINNSFSIDGNYLFEPLSGYSIGWKSGNYFPRQLWNSGNSQVIDEFMFFNYPLYSTDLEMIGSGWAADRFPQSTGSGIIVTTGITGFLTGINPVTGITGWGITGTGFYTNQYGISYTGYLSGQLTGTLHQTGVTPLTGIVNTPEYFIVPPYSQVNTGFLRQFYQDYVTFLRSPDNLDFDSISYDTGYIGSPDYKQQAVYDKIQDKFKIFTNNKIISFVNGIAQFSGQKINTGTIYNPIFILERDFSITGNYVDSTGFYNIGDSFWYNEISGLTFYQSNFRYTGGNSVVFTGVCSGNSMVFFNGQKIQSGLDYQVTGKNLIFNTPLYSGASGDLSVISLYGQRREETGNFAWKQTNTGFNPNYFMLFMNGQWQVKNQDYVTSDAAGMLSGSGIFSVGTSKIFSNFNSTDSFFV